MFFHYSIILFILKIRDKRPDQDNYDSLFFYIENNLREMGFGDVSVNKKMKDLNKIFYDILIKLNTDMSGFNMSKKLSLKYFEKLHNNDNNNLKGPRRLEPLSRNQFKDRNREFSQNILEYAIGRVK